MIDLGTLGGDFSYGTAISENGQVAGYSTIDATDGLIHAFLYQDGKMRDLGSLGDKGGKTDQSFAMGVNSAGQVVGYAFLSPSSGMQQVAFVYRDGAMQDLNKMIGGLPGVTSFMPRTRSMMKEKLRPRCSIITTTSSELLC